MEAKNWFKYDIALMVLWTIAFVTGLFSGISVISYCLIYAGLMCEILRHIIQYVFINNKIENCDKTCRGTHSCESCESNSCSECEKGE